MPGKESEKKCFIIAPIGAKGSEERKHSDRVLDHMIGPVLKKRGYEPIRADKIGEPGIITHQIINHIINDDLVIADLSWKNPNVFYELAIRHAIHKPIIQIIREDEKIPFDVSTSRTISFTVFVDCLESFKSQLEEQIDAVEKDSSNVDNPIRSSINLMNLSSSENPVEKSMAQFTDILLDVKGMVQEIKRRSEPFNIPGGVTVGSSLIFSGTPGENIVSLGDANPAEGLAEAIKIRRNKKEEKEDK